MQTSKTEEEVPITANKARAIVVKALDLRGEFISTSVKNVLVEIDLQIQRASMSGDNNCTKELRAYSRNVALVMAEVIRGALTTRGFEVVVANPMRGDIVTIDIKW